MRILLGFWIAIVGSPEQVKLEGMSEHELYWHNWFEDLAKDMGCKMRVFAMKPNPDKIHISKYAEFESFDE